MYPWRLWIAMIMGSLWYFSEYGQIATQFVLCVLCCYVSTPPILRNMGQESGTQTDEAAQEDDHRGNVAGATCFGFDIYDGGNSPQVNQQEDLSFQLHYPNVKRSLRQVFECAYRQLILPWYCVPEPPECQPLHQALGREFDLVVDRVISRARDFDLCEAVVGSVRILTQHFHNAKQAERDPLFGSRAEEMAVLRVFSEALVRNLFPESLCGLDMNRCALNEIVALKGLELLVTWLSNPDHLNQMVVGQLHKASPKSSVEELRGSDCDRTSSASQGEEEEEESEGSEEEECSEVSCENSENSSSHKEKMKLRSKKLKEGWVKFVDKVKYKRQKKKATKKMKMKKIEQELIFRAMTNQGTPTLEENGCSRVASVRSRRDSDPVRGDLEHYLASVQEDMMEFKLSYEMWRVGHWTVSIPNVDGEEEELFFTLHLEERDSPENLSWDIRKTYLQVIYFRNRWQDATGLPSITYLEPSSQQEASAELREEVRVSVELFLQELVSDEQIGHTQPVFQFLCPLDKLLNEEENGGGVWGLLSGLAYLLTPGQEEEEEEEQNRLIVDAKVWCSPEPETPTLNAQYSSEGSGKKIKGMTYDIVRAVGDSEHHPPGTAFEENSENSGSDSVPHNDTDPNNAARGEGGSIPLTSQLKKMIKGVSLTRSLESLLSPREADDEVQMVELSQRSRHNVALPEDSEVLLMWRHAHAKSTKKVGLPIRLPGGLLRPKGKEESALTREDNPQGQRAPVCRENLEATKAIFDLLKEITGNSILLNIFDAILMPVMPILKKKVNTFLTKMNPTELQMASYIDNLRNKQWPAGAATHPTTPRTAEEKQETKERAHQLINAKFSSYLILKKTDVENVFRLFQDSEENKKLVYMLLSFLLKEFLPHEDALNVSANHLQKVNHSSNNSSRIN
ncbi:unnamed protein product [Arctogadus glacialis]